MRADTLSTTNCILSEKLMFLNIHDRSDYVQKEKRVRFRLSPDPMEVELIDAVNSLTLGKETATEENNFIIPSNVISDIFRDAHELGFVQTVENSQQQQQNLPKQNEVVEVKEKKSVKRDVSSSPCEDDLVSDSEIKDMDVILMRGKILYHMIFCLHFHKVLYFVTHSHSKSSSPTQPMITKQVTTQANVWETHFTGISLLPEKVCTMQAIKKLKLV